MTLVVHLIGSLGIGGAERQLALLTKHVALEGVRQRVFVLSRASHEIGLDSRVEAEFRSSGVFGAIRFWWRLLRDVRRPGAVTVAWMYHAMLVAEVVHFFMLKRRRLVLNFRHSTPLDLRIRTRIVWGVVELLAKILKPRLVFNSYSSERNHSSRLASCQRFVVPNIASVGALSARTVVPRAFGFIGRNHHDKGADLLPEIVANLLRLVPEWDFVIAGPGTQRLEGAVRAKMHQFGVAVNRAKFIGSLANPMEFYDQVSIVVVPSRTESFPNVVVESLACGSLVSVMDVGDVRDILGEVLGTSETLDELVECAAGLSSLSESEFNQRLLLARELVLRPLEPTLIVDKTLMAWGLREMGGSRN